MRVCDKFLDFYVVSAHAPYMKSSTPYPQWWSKFKQDVVKLCKPGKPVVIGIDANSQLYKCDLYENVEVSLKGGKPPAIFLLCANALMSSDVSSHACGFTTM